LLLCGLELSGRAALAGIRDYFTNHEISGKASHTPAMR